MHETHKSPTRSGFPALFSRWTPRPFIAYMLNNKGVALAEQCQYSQAQKYLIRALRLVERDSQRSNGNKQIPAASILDSSEDDDDDNSSITSASTLFPTSKPKLEYDEGMDHYQKLFRLNNMWNENVDATILFNLGRVSHDQGNHDVALDYYKQALPAIHSNERLRLSVLYSTGHCLYAGGDMLRALQVYRAALSVAHSLEACHQAACLNAIGVILYSMPASKLDESLDAFQKSLEIRRLCLGENHDDVGTTWNNLGRLYFIHADYPKALDAYKEALRIRRSHKEALDGVDVAATLVNLGQVFNQLEDYEQALEFYRDFLRVAKTHFGEYHRDVCIVTTYVGQVLHTLKYFAQSLKVYHHALRIAQVVLGPIHSEIAIIFNKIGNLYCDTQDYDSALQAYHRGLAVELQVLDQGNANIIVTYSNIAEIHKERAEFDLALYFYQMMLKRQRATPFATEDFAMEVAMTLSNVAYMHYQKGDYERALEVNQECLRIRREQKGDEADEVAASLLQTALVLLKLDRNNMALETMLESYRIRKKLQQENRELACAMYNVALIYHQQGSLDSALGYYLETANIEQKILGSSHRDLSITFFNMAQIYHQRGELDLALQKFKLALEIERQCLGAFHPTCARTWNEIGNVELHAGNLPGMMEAYGEAFRIHHAVDVELHLLIVPDVKLWRFDQVQPPAAAMA